ncbi:MAG: hypothetical protein AAGC55_22105 [Myxococcota bacterium]
MKIRGKDAVYRFHEEWLGLAQPIEGLVFSIPVLADAQLPPSVQRDLGARFAAQLSRDDAHGDNDGDGDGNRDRSGDPPPPALRDVRRFFAEFLGYDRPGMLVERDQLPADMAFYAAEGRQEIRPSFALTRPGSADDKGDPSDDDDYFGADDDDDDYFGDDEDDFGDPTAEADTAAETEAATAAAAESAAESAPYLALVWDLADDLAEAGAGGSAAAAAIDLDKNETRTGPWNYPPTAKFARLLRHTGVAIGFVSNGRALRLVYAPVGESTAHLTFRIPDLAERAGRPLLVAL